MIIDTPLLHPLRTGAVVFATIVLSVVGWKAIHFLLSSQTLRLPPGPERNAFFGLFHVIPQSSAWKTLAEWGNKFGDVIYLRPFGCPVIVLNSFKACKDLLDKRGAIYSDRPRMVLLSELLPIRSFPFLPYGNRWRRQRRMMQQYFNSRAVANFRILQFEQASVLLNNLLGAPEDFNTHIHTFTTSTVIRISYGHEIKSPSDPYVMLVDKFVSAIDNTGPLGGSLVDLVPVLKYLPAWVPGAYVQKIANRIRPLVQYSLNKPYEDSKKRMAAGVEDMSLVSKLLKNYDNTGDSTVIDDIQQISAVMYRAGSLTSTSALKTFFLAMARNPEVALKAHEEIDKVIGRDRLPTYEDRASLPYVESVMKETLRWHPPVPLGLPHRVMKDDEYNGMLIPAGATVMFNAWQMMHDPAIFSSPETFNPDRFMPQENPGKSQQPTDPSEVVFGFGRRMCPGKWFAEAGLFMAMSSILATFTILPPLDDNGQPSMPLPLFGSGFSGNPEPFKCRIVPRDERAIKLIQENKSIQRA